MKVHIFRNTGAPKKLHSCRVTPLRFFFSNALQKVKKKSRKAISLTGRSSATNAKMIGFYKQKKKSNHSVDTALQLKDRV